MTLRTRLLQPQSATRLLISRRQANLFLCSLSGQRYLYCLSEIVPFWDSFFEFLARYIHFTISKLGHSQIGNRGIFVPDKLHRNKLCIVQLPGIVRSCLTVGNEVFPFATPEGLEFWKQHMVGMETVLDFPSRDSDSQIWTP